MCTQTLRLNTSNGSSSNNTGCCSLARCSFATNGRIHELSNSTGANFSVGKRVASPWPMIDAIASTRFDFSDMSVRKPGDAVADERPELAVAEAFPVVDVALVAAVARVHADHDVELGDELPERVELGQGERLAAGVRGHRSDAQQEGCGAAARRPAASSSIALSILARLMIGVAKMASE